VKSAKFSVKIKAICDSEESRGRLLTEMVVINSYKFQVEKLEKRAKQCGLCNRLGHFANECDMENALCARCGDEKHDGDCTKERKCINCGEAHSAYYKGCIELRKGKEKTDFNHSNQKNFSNITNSNYRTDESHRNYSSFKSALNNDSAETSSLLAQIIKQNEQMMTRQEAMDRKYTVMDSKLDNLVSKQVLNEALENEAIITNNKINASTLLAIDILKTSLVECMSNEHGPKIAKAIEINLKKNGINRTLIEEQLRQQNKRKNNHSRSSSTESNGQNNQKPRSS
jgi:hypothetical protein